MRFIAKITGYVSVLLAIAWPMAAHSQDATAATKWTQLAKLTESSGKEEDWLGWSTAISKDGNTAAVGAVGWCPQQGYNGCGQGAVFVFVKPPTGWANMTETAILTASDGQPGEYLGESVAISDDGNTIVAGAPYWPANGKGNGALYVFVKPESGWAIMTETGRLTTNDLYANLGQSVAISGGTIAGGGFGFNKSQGAAYVFVQPKSGWRNMTQTARLTASSGAGGLGFSISVSGDTVVAGAPGVTALVFIRPKGGWKDETQNADLTASDNQGKFDFGYSVSIVGSTIAVGAPERHRNGAVYMYVKPPEGWRNTTQTALLTADNIGFSALGYSVSLDAGAKSLVSGIPAWPGGGGPGAVVLYNESRSGWANASKADARMIANDGKDQDSLGFSVAASLECIAAGAPYAAIGSNRQQGAAYVFGRSNFVTETLPTTTTR